MIYDDKDGGRWDRVVMHAYSNVSLVVLVTLEMMGITL
jgi:hypothetical protein